MAKPHCTPLNVVHEQGEVIIDGPNGTTMSFTPEAAMQTAGRLDRAALEELLARAAFTTPPR